MLRVEWIMRLGKNRRVPQRHAARVLISQQLWRFGLTLRSDGVNREASGDAGFAAAPGAAPMLTTALRRRYRHGIGRGAVARHHAEQVGRTVQRAPKARSPGETRGRAHHGQVIRWHHSTSYPVIGDRSQARAIDPCCTRLGANGLAPAAGGTRRLSGRTPRPCPSA